jgi:hypothetical protein
MLETHFAAVDHPVPDYLISFLKAIPDGCYPRGARYSQCFLLLVAVLGILSGSRSSRNLEALTRGHRYQLNHLLGLNFNRWPTVATSYICTALRKPYGYNKPHLQEFG